LIVLFQIHDSTLNRNPVREQPLNRHSSRRTSYV
jgi:hypothetical protein